ncbi:hypothetical protein V1227_32380 [Lentzea sp. DG1S-22]|uniref:hypothetical protein n=1 Tax=unclassified Lentzea TaxID=2643253 RepID=UPI001F3E1A0A|nr:MULTISPECIES: hypothetical protein [unclassified Lentzea]MCG8920946.1 hypothetical protein [Lentzea sp. CC55]WVH79682.1 hypothetical protein V1227_32380 [Lentzea sp. DG1S-22]
MKRWVLVLTERGSDREGKRRRIAALLVVLGGLIGSWGVGSVLASDPIGYGVPVWPFADTADRAENALLTSVVPAVRGNLPVNQAGVQVLRRTTAYGSAFWTLKLEVDGETRCREVAVGLTVSSRRVECS